MAFAISASVALLFLLAASCAGPDGTKGPVAGGYVPAPVQDKEVAAEAEFAVRAQEKACGKNARLEITGILGAETQVVAGVTYRLTLKVRLDGRERTARAVVWWQPWRNPDPYRLTSWNWN